MIRQIRLGLIGSGLSLVAVGVGAALTSSSTIATTPSAALTSALADLQFAQEKKGVTPAPETPKGVIEPGPGAPSGRATKGLPLSERNQAEPPAPVAEPVTPPQPTPPRARREIHIAAPSADVRVNPSQGAVSVDAPYTRVDVNAERGRVRVRAPGVDLDVRW